MSYAAVALLAIFLIWVIVRLALWRVKSKSSGLTREQLGLKRDEVYSRFPSEPRTFGKRAALSAPYGRRLRRRPIALTPRMLQHVNIQRKLRGVPPLNNIGFKAAASVASQSTKQPDTTTDWLTYFILYECLTSDHHSGTVSGAGGITIDPEKPFNGQGGEFAGAGASGSWDAPAAALTTSALVERMSQDRIEPATAGDGYHYADPIATGDLPSGAAMSAFLNDTPPASDPTPSYSAPDPSPSVSDSSSSYSSSDSSSSSDSGSSGGGGDSGGGGGGGD